MIKYNQVKLEPMKGHKFKVLEPIQVGSFTIPKGYVTDGASVPRVFWCLFPPNKTDYLPCAIIHDYLCDKGLYKKADKTFKECLKSIGCNKFTIYSMYFAVRFYHIIRYGVLSWGN